ncbi:Phage-related protein [Ferriphaselus amnicola]|uniref:Phage-related protein n=1 Tax=Ferriphaselus amnicola TaxID=1188319 RepID=A0A2Z6GCR0_9PROT|nr:toprim domain-containing protein [Ferriphaselus amnicola]BBE51164.1 Phage-related protein [Ferriphaselus amnicola]
MNPRLLNDITHRLENDYGFKPDGEYLRKGECPSCHKREMYTSADEPWVIRCGRLNKCGAEYHVKELYPEIFTNWSERHPVTTEEPHAAADAYMRDGRGFDLAKVSGWYTQESYYSPELKLGSATVRFPLPGIGYWERIIDKPERFGKRKATFRGDYKGCWWSAPGLDLEADDVTELWIVEGIFDCIALLHHGITSVSALTCNNYPAKSLLALAQARQALGRKLPKLVWAMDTGKAGEDYTRKFVSRSREDGWESVAAQPPTGKLKLDWNELHQRNKLDSKMIEESLYRGSLLTAISAHEKALLMFNKTAWNTIYFGFESRLYWFEVNLEKYGKAMEVLVDSFKDLTDDERRERAMMESHTLREIANFLPTALYFQENKLTDEQWYFFRVDFPHSGESVKKALTPQQASKSVEFKSNIFCAPGAYYTANATQHDFMMKRWTEGIKVVEVLDSVGYSSTTQCYVFGDLAVKNGKLYTLNEEEYFEIGKMSIKLKARAVELNINSDLNQLSRDWIELLWQCYRYKGIAVLAFWLGSLFAKQIRKKHKSFPFLECVGEPGSGKSTLIEFLWSLCGRSDYEGFDPVKSSNAARARNFSQVSNLPIVLMEGDRTEEDRFKQRGFDWDELKPLFDGRSVYSRGIKNSGNETYEPTFDGALIISQNAEVKASPAMMERIVHIEFDKSSHTNETKDLADALRDVSMDDVSGFVLKATMAEKSIMETYIERQKHYYQHIRSLKGVRNGRVILNHSQLSAFVDCLACILPIGKRELEETHSFIEYIAVERQQALEEDHRIVQEFWETYEFLNGNDETPRLNHARKEELQIAINLNHFVAVASDFRQQIPELGELKKMLKTSRTHKFVGIKTVNSAINSAWNARRRNEGGDEKPATVKCWVFENPSPKK